MSHNLYARIQAALLSRPQHECLLTHDGRALSARALDAEVARLASVLVDAGVEPGDRVSAQVEKSLLNVLLYLAVLRIGGVYLPLNPAYTDPEVVYFLDDARPRVHVCAGSRTAPADSLRGARPRLRVMTLDDERGTLFDAFAAGGASSCCPADALPRGVDDLAAIVYTSGTTGKPKGAMLTHGNLGANADMLLEAWTISERDTLLHALPLFHVHGLFVGLSLTLLAGGTVILLPKFESAAVLEALSRATVMMGVPTYYTRLLAEPGLNRSTCAHMRLFISGSAPLSVETSNAFHERTGHRILERYGMTETGMSCSNPVAGDRRPGSVGRPLPGVQVRVVDEHGRDLPAGETGSLEVRGPHVFKGYWNLPEKTAAEFRDGWFVTGDLATLSDDDYVSIVGRSKDVIITGGLNVYPKEIEDVLDEQDGVVESAVVGVPHPDFGEGVVAVVVGAGPLDTEVLEAACRARLAGFKVPRRWVQLAHLPRNAMGKVQKNRLRADYAGSFEST